jgi:hypothetical protein
MTIFAVSAASLACAFYIYVLIKFVQDQRRIPRELSASSKSAVQFLGCPSH